MSYWETCYLNRSFDALCTYLVLILSGRGGVDRMVRGDPLKKAFPILIVVPQTI